MMFESEHQPSNLFAATLPIDREPHSSPNIFLNTPEGSNAQNHHLNVPIPFSKEVTKMLVSLAFSIEGITKVKIETNDHFHQNTRLQHWINN